MAEKKKSTIETTTQNNKRPSFGSQQDATTTHPPTHPHARTRKGRWSRRGDRPHSKTTKKKKSPLVLPAWSKEKAATSKKKRIWNKGAQNQDPRLASGGPRWPDVPHGRPRRGHKKKRHASKRKKCARYRKRSRPLDDGGRGFGVVACRSALAPRGTKRSSPPAIDRNVAIGGGLHASKVVRGNKPICENKKNGRLGR